MGINKKDVKTSADLQQYLQESSQKSERLYHYTTYESLVCIIKNKCFRLSRMDLLNDRAEIKLGNKSDHIKYYIMSLTRDKEYVSMWAMYGKPSGIKIRLDFNRKAFVDTINNNFYFDHALTKKIPLYAGKTPAPFSKKDYVISDIVYLDKKTKKLRHKENDFSSIDATEYIIDEMTGFIKYDAWEFERENRLRVRIYDQPRIDGQTEEIPRYIFAGLTDEFLKGFHITFNPWMSNELKEEIKKSLDGLTGFSLSYSDSQNDGEIMEL